MRKMPTYLKLLKGNPGKRAIRPEPEPAMPDKPPDPPAFLSEDAQNEWHRLAEELHRLGLLTVLDLMPFAAYCEAYSRWVVAERLLAAMADKDATKGLLVRSNAGSPMVNPLVKIARNAANDMLKFAGEFGMTPVARSRLGAGIGGPPTPGKFGDLLA
jgi:P27 family predicted phage terminase small subunit